MPTGFCLHSAFLFISGTGLLLSAVVTVEQYSESQADPKMIFLLAPCAVGLFSVLLFLSVTVVCCRFSFFPASVTADIRKEKENVPGTRRRCSPFRRNQMETGPPHKREQDRRSSWFLKLLHILRGRGVYRVMEQDKKKKVENGGGEYMEEPRMQVRDLVQEAEEKFCLPPPPPLMLPNKKKHGSNKTKYPNWTGTKKKNEQEKAGCFFFRNPDAEYEKWMNPDAEYEKWIFLSFCFSVFFFFCFGCSDICFWVLGLFEGLELIEKNLNNLKSSPKFQVRNSSPKSKNQVRNSNFQSVIQVWNSSPKFEMQDRNSKIKSEIRNSKSEISSPNILKKTLSFSFNQMTSKVRIQLQFRVSKTEAGIRRVQTEGWVGGGVDWRGWGSPVRNWTLFTYK